MLAELQSAHKIHLTRLRHLLAVFDDHPQRIRVVRLLLSRDEGKMLAVGTEYDRPLRRILPWDRLPASKRKSFVGR